MYFRLRDQLKLKYIHSVYVFSCLWAWNSHYPIFNLKLELPRGPDSNSNTSANDSTFTVPQDQVLKKVISNLDNTDINKQVKGNTTWKFVLCLRHQGSE